MKVKTLGSHLHNQISFLLLFTINKPITMRQSSSSVKTKKLWRL